MSNALSASARMLRPDAFKGTNVLVTGGTSGIGAAVSHAFSNAGALVTATGVSSEEVAALEFAGAARQLDIANAGEVDDVIRSLPKIDHLVNCAGIIRRGDEFSPDAFQQVIDVNLVGTMRVCTAARPKLADSKGSIVNTASMLSFFGSGTAPAYAASKGGVAQLTKSLAIAYASDGIRVNAVAPGWIRTSLTAALREDEQRSRRILERTPMGRWGEPGDIAGGVLFLCSELSAFVTGTVLVIDGGYSIM